MYEPSMEGVIEIHDNFTVVLCRKAGMSSMVIDSDYGVGAVELSLCPCMMRAS